MAVEQNAALGGVVEAGEQLNEGGFAGPVLAHQRQLFAGPQVEVEVAQGPLLGVAVLKAHILEHEAFPDGIGEGPHRLAFVAADAGLELEEVEEILEVERALGHRAEAAQNPFEQSPHAGKRAGQKRELADADAPVHGLQDDVDVGRVVARRAHRREERAPAGALHHEGLVLGVKIVGEGAKTVGEKAGEAEDLNLLGRIVGGAGLAQVVQLPALGRPAVDQRVAALIEVRLAQKGRHHGHQQQQQQPGVERHQAHGQKAHRNGILGLAEHLRHEHGAGKRLATGPLQLVVEGAVLELVEVELGGVLHQADGGLVGEQVAEQRIEQGHAPAEGIGKNGEAEFQRHQREHRREHALQGRLAAEADNGVEDELAHVEHGHRQGSAQQAQAPRCPASGPGWSARSGAGRPAGF